VTTTLGGFAAQAVRFPQHLEAATKKATEQACLAAKGAVVGSFRSGVGAPGLRNMGRKKGGTPFAASYTVKSGADGAVGILTARGGAAFLADLGSHKHPNGFDTRKGGRRRNTTKNKNVAAANALRVGFGLSPVSPKGSHPPVKPIKGGHHFQRGAQAAEKVAPRIYAAEVASAMLRTFR